MDAFARRISRRTLLRRGAALGLGLTAAARLGGLAGSGSPARAAGPFTQPLTFPPVITGSEITLTAAPTGVQLFPTGPATRMWTFNGCFPGPTIRRPSGQSTKLTLNHQLGDAGKLTLHHHGNHSSPDDDGQPRPEVMVAAGTSRTYSYDGLVEGQPERGALRFYHDHSHPNTTLNTWMGLGGLFILDDDVEAGLPLPRGEFELPLVITDRNFDASNQLVDPFSAKTGVGPLQVTGTPPSDDVLGTVYLVNGVPQPYVQVQARRYRLRILNLSVMRPYNLTLSGGGTLTQIGNESGLLPAPHQAAEYLIGPAQRLDVIADFSGLEGKEVILTSVDDTSSTSLATAPAALPASGGILQFRIGPASGADTTRIPRSLRALPDWVAQLPADHVDRVWAFGLAANDDTAQATTDQTGTAWTINGRTFDPTRIDAKPEVGTTETWALINTTPYKMSHFIHIHDVDSYVISRNGQPPTGDETGLKETFTLNPGDVVIVGLKFSDFTGPYMIHCHMLGHEDHGMMSTFAVVPPGQGDLPPTASGRNTHARLNGRRFTIPLHGQTPFSARMVQQVLRQVSHRPGCPADPRKAYRALHARVPAPVSSAPASPFYCKLG